MILLYVLLGVIWYISGAVSIIYWWTNEYDFTYDEIAVALASGLIGPFAYIVGWSIFGEDITEEKTIFKRRK